MMAMLSPDLLDRRALGLISLVDPLGAALHAPARLSGAGLRLSAKDDGHYLVLAATGLEGHSAAFAAPPATPALQSRHFPIDIVPMDRGLAPRRATLRLPRDPDATHADTVFTPIVVALLASPTYTIPATAAAVRVSVTKKSDGRRVGGTLVRVTTDNGQFAGHGVTDIAGEALVLIPLFPMAHTGGDASVTDGLTAKVTVVADPASAILTADADLGTARFVTYPDPDALADALAAPAGGTAVRLSVRKPATVAIEWTAP